MASKPKLKPCPCCGAKAELMTVRETFEVRGTVIPTWSHQIHCTRCPVQTCGIVGGDSDKLIAAWNTRAVNGDIGDMAAMRDANSIERLVRDAIIDYQEMYVHAPNDDAERELVERAKRGNAWLVAHGYEPEPVNFGKEEIPCL